MSLNFWPFHKHKYYQLQAYRDWKGYYPIAIVTIGCLCGKSKVLKKSFRSVGEADAWLKSKEWTYYKIPMKDRE